MGKQVPGMSTGQEATVPTLWLHLESELRVGRDQDRQGLPPAHGSQTHDLQALGSSSKGSGRENSTYRD